MAPCAVIGSQRAGMSPQEPGASKWADRVRIIEACNLLIYLQSAVCTASRAVSAAVPDSCCIWAGQRGGDLQHRVRALRLTSEGQS